MLTSVLLSISLLTGCSSGMPSDEEVEDALRVASSGYYYSSHDFIFPPKGGRFKPKYIEIKVKGCTKHSHVKEAYLCTVDSTLQMTADIVEKGVDDVIAFRRDLNGKLESFDDSDSGIKRRD